MEKDSFCRVSGESPETPRKLCFSTTFPYQEICEISEFYAVRPTYFLKLLNVSNVHLHIVV